MARPIPAKAGSSPAATTPAVRATNRASPTARPAMRSLEPSSPMGPPGAETEERAIGVLTLVFETGVGRRRESTVRTAVGPGFATPVGHLNHGVITKLV